MDRLIESVERLRKRAYKLTEDIDKSKDLIQDLYVRVFSNKERLETLDDEHLNKCVYRALMNLFYDIKKSKAAEYNVVTDKIDLSKTVENDVWGVIQKKEMQSALINIHEYNQSRTNKKSNKPLLAFRLIIDGYRYNEVAEMINSQTTSVCGYAKKFKDKLKKQLL